MRSAVRASVSIFSAARFAQFVVDRIDLQQLRVLS